MSEPVMGAAVYRDAALDAARAGGAVLMEWFDRKSVREKRPKDLVTEADFASQEAIRGRLLAAFPDHGFLGEEGQAKDSVSGFRWIVDPLDGTVNYVHRLPGFAVSIALEFAGKMLLGVVYDPLAQECFTAEAGGGAFLNGNPIQPSACEALRDALVAASFSANVARDSVEIARFLEVLEASQSIRRLGSAALNLCYVAMGRLDAYWTTSVQSWDIAAGALILGEAGGIVTGLDGGQLDWLQPEMVAAGRDTVHRQLVATLKKAAASR